MKLGQFQVFLLAVQQYFDYYILYQKIDVSNERNISYEEFTWAKENMEKNFGEIVDLKELFDSIPNKQPSGEIDFDEFCDWAIIKSFKFRGLYVEAVESFSNLCL